MKYYLTVFGDCRLDQSDNNLLRIPAQAAVMLTYLYVSARPIPRRTLAKLLWPQSNQTAALTNLRSMLRRFVAQMPNAELDFLETNDHHLQINRDALGCDLESLDSHDPSKRMAGLCNGVQKVFLPAYGVGDSELDKWVQGFRKNLLETLRTDFLSYSASASVQKIGNKQQLKHTVAVLLEHDPLDEDVRRALASLVSVAASFATAGTGLNRAIELPSRTLNADQNGCLAPPPRIALLPPGSLCDGQNQKDVANALIEDITISLCADRSVSVVAPYTSQKIACSNDKASLLEEHKVVFALDTKKTKEELFVQLIYMPTDEIIWAHRFHLEATASTKHRSLIQEAIQTSISEQITTYSPYLNEFNTNPDAYFSYLTGLQTLSSMTLPSVRRARKHFKEALKIQSRFSPALAGISRTLSMEWVLTARGDASLLDEAARLAKIAIEEDKGSAGAYKELGVSQLYMGQIDESLQSLQQAETLSPHYADVLCSYADSLTHGGRPSSSLEKISAAISLNPLAPDTYLWTAAGASYFIGEYQQAIDYIRQMKDSSSALRLAAACWGMLGQTVKARSCRQRVLKDNPDFDLEMWLAMIPHKEKWQTELYREGLLKAGF